MKMLIAAILAALCLTPAQAAAQRRADVIIRHAVVVDVERARLIPDQMVAISGASILAVGADADMAKSWSAARTVDGRGRYLIPGLWDMHVHFGGGPALVEENKALLPLYVAHGITTVRDASGDIPLEVLSWRDEIAAGKLFGPTLLSSGPKIEGIAPVWKGTLEAGSEADIDAALTKLKALHVDFVKITDSTLKPDLFLYAVRQAHAAGLRTSGHIPAGITVRQAIDAGLSSIEHLAYAYRAGLENAGGVGGAQPDTALDPQTAVDAYRYMATKQLFVTPTLNVSRILAYLDRDDHRNDDELAYIGPGIRQTYNWRVERAAQATPEQIATRHARYERTATILPMLQQAGVTIMAGTDAGFLNSFDYPATGLHDELALFVEKGLTPAQALSAATRAGPAWFGLLDRYGSIEAGKAADLTLLDGNPLEDIHATRAIRAVVLRGTVYDRAELDWMLSDTRAKVASWNAAAAR